MKHFLLSFGTALLALASPAQAARTPTAPADTVAGHARMVRKLSDAMCVKLTNDHTTNFDKLTTPEAMQMTQQLFIGAMQRDSVAFLSMIASATKEGKSPQTVGQEVGRDVVIRLSQSCPASMPLIVRLSQTEQAQQVMNSKMPAISEAEKKTLQPLATHLCAQLAAADAKQKFAQRLPAQRSELFTTLIQKEFLTNRTQLLRYYSAPQLEDPERMREIGQKIASLMLAQPSCGGYVMLVGADEVAKQKP